MIRSTILRAPNGIRVTLLGILALGLLLPAAASAGNNMQGTAWLLGALPQGEFKDNLDQNGFGLGGSFGYRFPQSPVSLGGELNYAIYGHNSRDQYFAGLPVRVTVETNNSIVEGLLYMRVQPPTGPVRPYVDGLVGFNYFFTSTTIKNRSNSSEIASDTNQDDTALAYGGGGGVMFRLSQRPVEPGKSSLSAILLDIRARYLVGGNAEYLDPGQIRLENDQILYQIHQSKTDLLTVGVGVTFEF
jgi:opacity protein-like surface antigen